MAADDVVIAGVARTPFGKFGGALREVPAIDLGTAAVTAVLDRCGLEPEAVDELNLGCCIPAEAEGAASVVARQVLLEAGVPPDRLSVTLDRACCSALSACAWGWRSLRLGEAGLVVAGGTENMSRAPHLVRGLRWGLRLGAADIRDPLFPMAYQRYRSVALDAGEVAVEHGIDRAAQDRWALGSQQRYEAARRAGKMDEEIAPIDVPGRRGESHTVAADEFPKPDTTLEGLSRLRTVYASPTVTAGNAPGLDTGAAVCVLTTRGRAAELGLEPLAQLKAVVSAAEPPRQIATIPAKAIGLGLERLGWRLDELKRIEINEAFAAMPLVSSQLLAGGEGPACERLRERINVNGGAIAIGHPIGASGARILMTLVLELRRLGGGRGAAAICGGLAQGDCALVEV